jgi:murein DD-endopeptidase MepM/ murein hydrolase activator NlpD
MFRHWLWVILWIIVLSACAKPSPANTFIAPPQISTVTLQPIPSSIATTLVPLTQPPQLDPSSTPAILVEPSSTPAILTACSPLTGIPLSDIPKLVSNGFDQPQPGQDDGHHGIDIAFYRYGDQTGMTGFPIQAILSGKIAAVIINRPPYGNAVIIETPLTGEDSQITVNIQLPAAAATVIPSRLSCPKNPDPLQLSATQRSLYLLYAHMNQAPKVKPGDKVSCGQPIGEVGTSGMSVNPHLHLETRIGPSGAHFDGLAHYTGDASQQEMANYCLWRVSGLFQMFDPLTLLQGLSPR